MTGISRATGIASFSLVLAMAAVSAAEPLTIDKAQELSKLTGRPILAVAGSKT